MTCDLCDYRTMKKHLMTSHIRVVHEKDKHHNMCSVCAKTFATRAMAASHEKRAHFLKETEEITFFDCAKCGAKQMNEKNYKKHLLIVHEEHTDDSPICDTCGKTFTNMKGCRDHIKFSHPTAKELAKVQCDCEKCLKVFQTSIELNDHLKECLENPPNLTCIFCLSGNW